MGTRGPKPGWKKGATPVAALSVEAVPAALAEQPAPMPPSNGERLTAADMSNPAKLAGEALRKLAHTRGMSRSEMARLSDEQVRVQLKYLTFRQYDTAEA